MKKLKGTLCRLWLWQSSGRTKVYLALCLHTQRKGKRNVEREWGGERDRRQCSQVGGQVGPAASAGNRCIKFSAGSCDGNVAVPARAE